MSDPYSDADSGKKTIDRRALTGGGLKVGASTHTPDPSKLPTPTRECRILWRSFFGRRYDCGHRASRRFRVSMYGTESRKINNRAHCPECFIAEEARSATFCGLCGLPIFVGDPVALYGDDGSFGADATRAGDCVVGCLAVDCCPSGAFYAGNWSGTGVTHILWEETDGGNVGRPGKPGDPETTCTVPHRSPQQASVSK